MKNIGTPLRVLGVGAGLSMMAACGAGGNTDPQSLPGATVGSFGEGGPGGSLVPITGATTTTLAETAPATPVAPAEGTCTVQVQSGDVFSVILNKLNDGLSAQGQDTMTQSEFQAANPQLENINNISVGAVLNYPCNGQGVELAPPPAPATTEAAPPPPPPTQATTTTELPTTTAAPTTTLPPGPDNVPGCGPVTSAAELTDQCKTAAMDALAEAGYRDVNLALRASTYQRLNGLMVDGVVGPMTFNAIDSDEDFGLGEFLNDQNSTVLVELGRQVMGVNDNEGDLIGVYAVTTGSDIIASVEDPRTGKTVELDTHTRTGEFRIRETSEDSKTVDDLEYPADEPGDFYAYFDNQLGQSIYGAPTEQVSLVAEAGSNGSIRVDAGNMSSDAAGRALFDYLDRDTKVIIR